MREGWKEYTLGELCSIYNGSIQTGPFGAQLHEKEYDLNGDYHVVMPKDIDGNSVNLNSTARISDITFGRLSRYAIEVNDIIYPRRGDISKRAFIKNNLKGICGTGCLRVRFNSPEISVNFLNYYLSLDESINWLNLNSVGATMKNLNTKILGDLPISLPPLETQKKIASILSGYDDLIENNLKRIKILEEMAQQTYEEWFVRMRFPGHQSTTINPETGLPEGWEKDFVSNQLGKVKSTTKIKSSEFQDEGNIPVVDQSRSFIAGFTDDKSALIEYVDVPYIVFGDHTRILKLINFDFARGADGTQIVLSKNPRMPQHLFYFSLLNIDLSNYHYARHYKYLKDSEIIIPTENIAKNFEQLAKENFDAIQNLRNQNQRLREARDILLPRLMMGMVEV